MTITDWPEGDWPCKKLLAKGALAQSDAELLAIYLRTGVKCALPQQSRCARSIISSWCRLLCGV